MKLHALIKSQNDFCSFRRVLWLLTQCFKLLNFGSRPSDHYFRSVFWSVCLFVCLCKVFLSRLWSNFDQTRRYVTCLGL